MKRRPVNKLRQTALPFDLVEPRASALVESLRAFGYSLRTAIADLAGAQLDPIPISGRRNTGGSVGQ
jgi:hypothetical protein